MRAFARVLSFGRTVVFSDRRAAGEVHTVDSRVAAERLPGGGAGPRHDLHDCYYYVHYYYYYYYYYYDYDYD